MGEQGSEEKKKKKKKFVFSLLPLIRLIRKVFFSPLCCINRWSHFRWLRHYSFNLRNIIRWLTENVFSWLGLSFVVDLIRLWLAAWRIIFGNFSFILRFNFLSAINFIRRHENKNFRDEIQLHFSTPTFVSPSSLSTAHRLTKNTFFLARWARHWNGYKHILIFFLVFTFFSLLDIILMRSTSDTLFRMIFRNMFWFGIVKGCLLVRSKRKIVIRGNRKKGNLIKILFYWLHSK